MISVIIPVFNNWNLSQECLLSLAKTTENEDIEVIVVDNASTDATRNECSSFGENLFPERFFYFRQDENRNYAGANNIAAAQARGNFLFLLNNDTIAQDGWLPPLRKAMERGVRFGRQVKPLPDNFLENCALWRAGLISGLEAAKRCHMPQSTFYRKAGNIRERFPGTV